MLLTIKQSAHQSFKSFHDYTPPTPPSTSRFSPPVVGRTGATLPPLPTTNSNSLPPLPASKSSTQQMSTPHRGLPPPAALTLPQPQQAPPPPLGQPPPPLSQPMGQLPAPPAQWQGAEESMRNWLHAKAEEDKRKQEEEKTRQESLRLEQRKIEQDMLRTSLSGGIPPYLIPLVFAGMGGGNLPNASLEWAQHYMAQTHQLQQQQQQLLPSQAQTSPEQLQRRDSRVLGPPYSGQQQHPPPMTLPSTPIGPGSSQQGGGGFIPSYPLSPASRQRQIAQTQGIIARPPQNSHLPRLNTGEMHIQPPPAGPNMPIGQGQSGHPLQHSQSAQQQEPQSSPSIYFHHWQPPTAHANSSSGGNHPPTTPSDHASSPKKRKATGPQQPAPPPTSQPQYTSPPFSQPGSSATNTPNRRRGHSRQASDMSARGLDSYGRPMSRHRHTESGFTSQSVASPRTIQENEHGQTSTAPPEPRRRSGGAHPVSSLLDNSDSRPQPQSQQSQRDSQYTTGPEMRHDERRTTPEDEHSRRSGGGKRDDGRD